MKNYELITIVKATISEEEVKKIQDSITKLIESQKGSILENIVWGKRKLAYKIKAEKEGNYSIIKFQMEPDNLLVLKSKLNLVEGLVRYLITLQS